MKTLSSLMLLLLLIIALHPHAVAAAKDSDGDGISDDNEVVLGTDPNFAEPLTLLCDDKAKGKGDKSTGRDLLPRRDFTKVYFAPVAKGRYLWRIDFVDPFVVGSDNVLILYLDVDNNRETGRKDKAFARGVDVMFRPSGLQLIEFPRTFRPAWSSAIQGTSVYLAADLPICQRDGKSTYRMFLLSQNMLKGKNADSDRTPWTDVAAPGESDRAPRPWVTTKNENVVNWHMTRRAVRDLARNPANAPLSPKECRLKGFEPDEKRDEVSGGRHAGAGLTFSCPKRGRLHVAWVIMNYGGQDQAHAVFVNGERKGFGVCDELGRGQQFFTLEQPIDFTGSEKIEIRVMRHGNSFRFRNVLLLTELPKRPSLHIVNLAAAPVFQPDGSRDGRITWITNRACASEVRFGPTPAYGNKVTQDEAFINNHRVFLRDIEPGTIYHYRVIVKSYKGESIESEDRTFVTKAPHVPTGKIARAEVPLSVGTAKGAGQADVYVSSGVPFPVSHLASPTSVQLLDDGGRETPVQTRALARWPDGTVKWLHLVFPARVSDSTPRKFTLRYGTAVKSSRVKSGIRLTESADGVTIVTGPLQIKLSRRAFSPPGTVWLDANGDGKFEAGERMTDDGAESCVTLRDAEGKAFTSLSPPDEVVVEEAGPLRASVRIRGTHQAADGAKLFAYTVRLYAYAGKPYVRVFYTFGNDNLKQMFTQIKGISLSTGVQLGPKVWCVFGGEAAQPVGAKYTVGLYQDYENHYRRTRNGDVLGEGKQAVGWVRLSNGTRGLTVSVRNFWQLYPKAFTMRGDRIEVGLLPALAKDQYAKDKDLEDRLFYYALNGLYKFRQGFEKRHELLYHFHTKPGEADAVALLFQHPVVAAAPPKWNCDTEAFGRVTPTSENEFPWYERRFEKSVERTLVSHRERYREYGMMNFGDWYGERRYNWGNMEYDTPFVLLAQYLRRGDAALFEFAQQAARHNMDVDTIHHHADPTYVGAVYAHCIGHTGWYYPYGFRPPATPRGGCSPGHTWNRGTFLYHFLTGDPRARETALDVSNHIAEYRTRNYTIANHASRDHSWPILACLTAYEVTHDPFYINGAKIIADKVIEGQDPVTGSWLYPAGYSDVMPQKLGGYAWCVGLLLNSLNWYRQHLAEPTEIEAAKTCMIRAADWLIASEWMPKAEGFRSTSCPSFNQRTRPGSSTWSVSPGLVVVAKMTGDNKYRDYALRAYRHTLDRVDGMGKSLTQNLCMTLHMLYDLKQMGITRFREASSPAKVEAPPRLLFARNEPIQIPVYLTSQSFGKIAGSARIMSLPAGWRAAKRSQPFAVNGLGSSTEMRFAVEPARDAAPGKDYRVTFEVESPNGKEAATVAISIVGRRPRGKKCGLIAGKEDFLGPALKKAGVQFERIHSVAADLTPYAVIFLGTQAHTLDAAGVSSKCWRLWRYVKEGGLLAVSQMNDDNWMPHYLPGAIQLGEDNSASGKIARPGSPLFNTPHRLTDVSGAVMFDHIKSRGPEWQALLQDTRGRPAVMEGSFGHGRIVVFEPSFERFFADADTQGAPAKPDYAKLFENLVRYLLKMAGME